MDNRLSSLYRLGGLTGILSGVLMLASSIWFLVVSDPSIVSDLSQAGLGNIGIFHGIGVVTLILLVPTLLASYGLLSSETPTRSALGASIAVLWITIELIAHCSQTAPVNTLSELMTDKDIDSLIGEAFYAIWAEWGEALFMTGAFLCVLMALCYGSALYAWGNPIAAYLFFISIVAFPAGLIFGIDVQLHVLIRGIAFLFLGGVLIQVPYEEDI